MKLVDHIKMLFEPHGILPRVRRLFNSSNLDTEFIKIAYEADGDKCPSFPTNLEYAGWAMFYYGYLVGKYGKDWEAHQLSSN